MGPERAMVTLFSLISTGFIGYCFYHILTTGDILKILISGALGIASTVFLVIQMRKNIKG
ncbi:MAG: hypothetical protein ACI4KH_03885 [Oscillospiraceae bacterium]